MKQQLKAAVGKLYPPLRTFSGQLIKTHEVRKVSDTDDGFILDVVKLFPPSDIRRANVTVRVVTEDRGGLKHSGFEVVPASPIDAEVAQQVAKSFRQALIDDGSRVDPCKSHRCEPAKGAPEGSRAVYASGAIVTSVPVELKPTKAEPAKNQKPAQAGLNVPASAAASAVSAAANEGATK